VAPLTLTVTDTLASTDTNINTHDIDPQSHVKLDHITTLTAPQTLVASLKLTATRLRPHTLTSTRMTSMRHTTSSLDHITTLSVPQMLTASLKLTAGRHACGHTHYCSIHIHDIDPPSHVKPGPHTNTDSATDADGIGQANGDKLAGHRH
jgi:hypothetical protein